MNRYMSLLIGLISSGIYYVSGEVCMYTDRKCTEDENCNLNCNDGSRYLIKDGNMTLQLYEDADCVTLKSESNMFQMDEGECISFGGYSWFSGSVPILSAVSVVVLCLMFIISI
eukprot:GHVR01168418.1.p1 GENE.GHVR01168418.1~~GHVR01168418.1.p1  ORF type:complete len:114 (+),score=19.19 GHVR01168418.1:22-363(+)